MYIKFIKFIIEHLSLIEEYEKDVEKYFDMDKDYNEFNQYARAVERFISTGKNDLDNNKIVEMINKHAPLYNSMVNCIKEECIENYIFDLSFDTNKDIIQQLVEHPEERQRVYKNMIELEKLGINYIDFIPFEKYKLGPADNYVDKLSGVYMNSLKIVDINNNDFYFEPTAKTNFFIEITIHPTNKGDTLVYSEDMGIKDIIKFNVTDIPTTVEQFKKYANTIKAHRELFKEKQELVKIRESYKDMRKSFSKVYKIVQKRKIYDPNRATGQLALMHLAIDDYVDENMARIREESNKMKTKEFRVRI